MLRKLDVFKGFALGRSKEGAVRRRMRITRTHNLNHDELRHRVDDIAESLRHKLSLSSRWQGDALRFSGKGVEGQLYAGDSDIEITVKLDFVLKLMEPSIRMAIEEELDRQLG